jgi:hypothetical protein
VKKDTGVDRVYSEFLGGSKYLAIREGKIIWTLGFQRRGSGASGCLGAFETGLIASHGEAVRKQDAVRNEPEMLNSVNVLLSSLSYVMDIPYR